MSQTEDIDAINAYFKRTAGEAAGKPAAQALAAKWFTWYDALGWYEKWADGDVYNKAREIRDSYNSALGKATPAELKAAGWDVMTTERMSDTDTEFTKMPAVTTYTEPKKTAGQTHATIKLNSAGADVMTWQKIIGVTADGKFGPLTDKATKLWQQQHGITPDGIVGEQTWAAALGQPVTAIPEGFAPEPVKSTPIVKTAVAPKKTSATVIKAPTPIAQASMFGKIGDTFNTLSTPVKAGLVLGAVGLAAAVDQAKKKKHH
jgi:peptidoglycan hydrolase-like protein with peptidoglycan-binding domain